MTELRFQISLLLSEASSAARILTPEVALKDLQDRLHRVWGWLPGITVLVKSTERVIAQSEIQVGDKIRILDGAFGDAYVSEIRAGLIYVERPFIYGADCSADVAGTMGSEKITMFTDSDKTVVLLERAKVLESVKG